MKRLFWLLSLILILLCNQSATAKEWPAKTNVPLNKVWTITFNQAVDRGAISDLSVYIMNVDKYISTKLAVSTDRKTVTVDAEPDYLPGQTYTLFIHKYITSNGKQLGDTSQLTFTTVAPSIIPVTSILLSQTAINLAIGDSPYTLVATVSPENATNKSLIWNSSNQMIATVNNGIITPLKEGTTNITASSSSNNSIFASCNVTVKAKEITVSNITSIGDLVKYLNLNFTKLETPMGTWRFTHSYIENTYSFFPYNYWLQTDYLWSDIGPYDIKYSIKYSDTQKEETKKLLREYQQNIASIAIKALPDKKIQGGYYHGGYKYPSIHAGYYSTRFLTWKNYTGKEDYNTSIISIFQWDSYIDDYDFTI